MGRLSDCLPCQLKGTHAKQTTTAPIYEDVFAEGGIGGRI